MNNQRLFLWSDESGILGATSDEALWLVHDSDEDIRHRYQLPPGAPVREVERHHADFGRLRLFAAIDVLEYAGRGGEEVERRLDAFVSCLKEPWSVMH